MSEEWATIEFDKIILIQTNTKGWTVRYPGLDMHQALELLSNVYEELKKTHEAEHTSEKDTPTE